ncbi:MAG: hypothetical protein QNJ33_11135 [Crocosphaera sp.]|nr:hypothetical protein [Crocosphaera sp.]
MKTILTASLGVVFSLSLGSIALSEALSTKTINSTKLSYHRSSNWEGVASGRSETFTMSCPANQYVISGGFETAAEAANSSEGFTVIKNSFRTSKTWEVRLRNQDDIQRSVKLYIVCVN